MLNFIFYIRLNLCRMQIKDEFIIEIDNLWKYYHGEPILKNINFKAKKGELISIVGKSGCGKTTLLRCMNCLEILDAGKLRVDGVTLERGSSESRKSIERKSGRLRRITGFLTSQNQENRRHPADVINTATALRSAVGMLFQSYNLFPHLTVLENMIKAPIVVKGMERKEAEQLAFVYLEKVGLANLSHKYPHQISGGQAQRAAIARALAMKPQVMLYDEPTSALDPELAEEVIQVMRNLHEEGMTQIVVTHLVKFARNDSDRIALIDKGEIVEIGSPDELVNSPKDERTRNYFSNPA